MRITLYVLLSLVLVLGGYVLYLYYKRTLVKVDPVVIQSSVQEQDKDIYDVPLASVKENAWTSQLNESSELINFQYPSNIFSISLDVKRESDFVPDHTKVSVKNIEDYKFFYLSQILKKRSIHFSYYKNGGNVDLVLFVPNISVRDKLLEDLRHYNIEYELNFKK